MGSPGPAGGLRVHGGGRGGGRPFRGELLRFGGQCKQWELGGCQYARVRDAGRGGENSDTGPTENRSRTALNDVIWMSGPCVARWEHYVRPAVPAFCSLVPLHYQLRQSCTSRNFTSWKWQSETRHTSHQHPRTPDPARGTIQRAMFGIAQAQMRYEKMRAATSFLVVQVPPLAPSLSSRK